MATENLTTYTEVDSGADITVSASAAQFDTMRRDAVSYVYKDFGAGYFSNFDIDFEFEITSVSGNSGVTVLCAVSNTIGTLQDFIDNTDGIDALAFSNTGNLEILLTDRSNSNEDSYIDGGTSSNLLYCTMQRIGTTTTLRIYSDSGRTTLVDTLSITCETETKRYFYALISRDSASAATDTQTGYTQNFEISDIVTIDGISSSISIDNIAVTQKHTLEVAALDIATTMPNLDFPLQIGNIASAVSIDNIVLTQKHTLTAVNYLNISVSVDPIVSVVNYGTEDERAIKLYTFTLSGAEDGYSDLEIPISSFQGRMKSGESSYLSAVIPTLDYLDEINLRPNGEIFVTLNYEINGVVTHSEEIARANFNQLRWDKGGLNESITISGYKITTHTPKGVELPVENVTYQGLLANGKSTFRFATPDLNIRPSDSAKIGDDTIVVGLISYSVSTAFQTMQLTEA